jgi:hypothetical protein
MIAASINAHPVQALLDSAAEATLIDRDFAKQLNLHSSSVAQGQGSGRDSFEAGMVEGVELQALGLSLPNQTVAIVDLSDVGHRLLGRRLDVILGREIFDAARLWIDIDGRRIKVVPRTGEPAGVRLELTTEHGVETLPVRVEGQPVRGGGLGGATMRQRVELKSLEVAGRIYQDVHAEIDVQPSASDVNIGVNVLRHFFITADFANHAVWLEPRR